MQCHARQLTQGEGWVGVFFGFNQQLDRLKGSNKFSLLFTRDQRVRSILSCFGFSDDLLVV